MSLRILILVENFNPTTETFIYHDVLAFQKRATVKVVCLKRENEDTRPIKSLEIITIQRNWINSKWNNQLYKFNISLNYYHRVLKDRLSAILREFQPQVVHLHFGSQALQFIDNMEYSGPLFITFHGYDATKLVKKSAVYRSRLKELFNRKNIYPLFVSHALLKNLKHYGIESLRSRVLYLGIDPDYFNPEGLRKKNEDFIFLQISSFRAKKGQLYLIEAFSRLITKNYFRQRLRLVLVGGGEFLEACKKIVAQKNLINYVNFHGWVDRERTRQLLAESNVFVHPSITPEDCDMEGLPISIMEAMAMELPVFATWHSGIPELVEHGVNGLLAQEKDIDSYVNCLKDLLKWSYQPQNRQKIIDQFDHARYIDKLLSIYRQALSIKL